MAKKIIALDFWCVAFHGIQSTLGPDSKANPEEKNCVPF